MNRDPASLEKNLFDLLIIGGGITGACMAHDAALRGIRTALVEKADFGGFTSSASSKLLHGGIRYFPKAQFHKTRESARERTIFQVLAPHLTRYIPFMVPTYSSGMMKGAFVLRSGMMVYDAVCAGLDRMVPDPGKRVPKGAFLSRPRAIAAYPALKSAAGVTGAQVYYESHMHSSERMTLAFLATARSNGARIGNYLEVERLLVQGGTVVGAAVRDRLDNRRFTIRARVVANAAGPVVERINATCPGLKLNRETTGFSKGVHLVTRQIHPHYAVALTTPKKTEGWITRGGRHVFIIPWRGRSIIGTTDVPFDGNPDRVRPTRGDISDFVADINATLPAVGLSEADVRYAFAGLYPLIAKRVRGDTYQGTGEYQVVDHLRQDGIDGVLTVLGAKYTTARKVAQMATDMAQQKLDPNRPRPCCTHRVPLDSGRIGTLEAFVRSRQERYRKRLSARAVTRLVFHYGCDIDRLLDAADGNLDLLAPVSKNRGTLGVEVVYAVASEMAQHLSDVVFRRTGIGTVGHPGREALDRCARLMAVELGWDRERIDAEINATERHFQYR
jgi:glycerol-3-phosphate dehydrogenase